MMIRSLELSQYTLLYTPTASSPSQTRLRLELCPYLRAHCCVLRATARQICYHDSFTVGASWVLANDDLPEWY